MTLQLRSRTGALVVGVRRGTHLLEKPDPNEPFEAGDVIYFVGTSEAIQKALRVLSVDHPDDRFETDSDRE